MKEMIGRWAFIIGFIIAILAGLFGTVSGTLLWVLVVLGLIIGFLNVTGKETTGFLLASIALIVFGSSGLQVLGLLGDIFTNILKNIVAIIGPAALVVAIKAVYEVAKEK